MDYQEAIEELESLWEHCSDEINEFDPDSIWRKDCKALDVAISAMHELEEYRQLGTMEEVLEAVERHQAKKPSPMLGIYGRVYECKECGNELEMHSKYCPFCGQKQEWE